MWDVAVLSEGQLRITFTEIVDPASSIVVRVEGEGSNVEVLSALIVDDGLEVVTAPLVPGIEQTITIEGVVGANGLGAGCSLAAVASYRPTALYASDIQPVFDRSCAFVGCHAASDQFPPGEGLVLTADRSWGSLVGISSGQISGRVRVAPGLPDSSYLVQKLQGPEGIIGDPMPQGGLFLAGSDLALIELWVEQGALDN
ncbi:MAG: hypothetical protein CME26_10005 [Gemmatimonadetes bacterium]|nr:hypothetical protein [Gemmatimonadota bacterium]